MKKSILLLAAITFFSLSSGTAFANRCTLDDSSIVATVADRGTVFPYNLLTSDGGGPYSTFKAGSVNIAVMFQICDGSKDFTMNLNSSARSLKQLLAGGTADSKYANFDRVASVPVTVDSSGFAAFCGGRNGDGSIIMDTPNTTTADNYAGCGQDSNGFFFVRRNVVFTLTAGHSLRLQDSPYDGGNLGTGTSYVKVYHPTSSTWTLTVEDTPAAFNPICGTNGSCGAMIYKPSNGPAYVQYGVLDRFEISLTSLKVYP